jgi:hypothetical protein
VVILLGAAALRLAFLAGFLFYDDAHYVDRAVALGLGKAGPPESIFTTRIGLVGPAALLYRLSGVGPLTTAAFPLL